VEGGAITIDADLTAEPLALNRVIVSVARRTERALDVAAAVSVIDDAVIQRRVATSPLDYVSTTPGVDFAVQGLQGRQVVGRGFSGTFGPSLLMLSDYRNAALPSVRASLSYFLTPNGFDLDRVEVVRGPASALYGSNAADGLVHFITKSPFDSPGTGLSITGGDRSLLEVAGRHAGVASDRFAYKVSGTYFRGVEWPSPPQPSEVVPRNPIAERVNGEVRADYRVSGTGTAVMTLGSTTAIRTVEYTPIGTYQLDHSRADFAQVRYRDRQFFAQVYVNRADSPAGTTTSLQTGQTAIDKSTTTVAQLQHGFGIGGRTDVTYGVDLQRTNPKTGGTVNGKNESDDTVLENGAYVQASTQLAPKWQLIGAARVDKHSRLRDPVFSPRAALVYSPAQGQRVRFSYNRAFSTPTPGNLFLDVLAASLNPLPYNIRAVGVPASGFTFARDCSGLCMRSPFAPGQKLPLNASALWPAVVQILQGSGVDLSAIPAPGPTDVSTVLRAIDLRSGAFVATNGSVSDVPALVPTTTNAFEVGYRGLIGQRFIADVSVYRTQRSNFIAPLTVATPNVFLSTASVAAYLGRFMPAAQAGQLAAGIGGVNGNPMAPGIPLGTVVPNETNGGPDILLTYRNIGDVTLWGADVSAEFAATDHVALTGSYSWTSDNFFAAARAGDVDLSTNTPRSKAQVAARVYEGARDASIELRGRYVGTFRMADGVWNGKVPAFAVGDIEAGIAVPGARRARFSITVQNVADKRHSEFLSAPILGRLALTRLQYMF
jgi:iron complex outermembrane receptor protein